MNFSTVLKRIVTITLAAITLISTVALISCGTTSDAFTYKTNIGDVKDVLNTKDKKYLVLVNKDNTIGENYNPGALARVNSAYTNGGKEVELEKNVARAAEALIIEMRAEGINDVYITSGYRSYSYQVMLFNRYCAEEKEAHPTWSDDEIRDQVLTYSAAPGTSEHHTGLCMDLITTSMVGLWNYGSETPSNPYDVGFAETEAFEWLKDNAHKFGFILRYPEDKVSVTKYSYESWHYRFVGISAATEIYEKGITLEEYLGK